MTSPSRILCAVCLLLLTVTPAHHPAEQVPVVAADPVTVIPTGELHDELYAYAAATTTTTSTLPPPTTTVARDEGTRGAQQPQEVASYDAGAVGELICSVFVEDCGRALRVAKCESGFRADAVNGHYRGIFQIGDVHASAWLDVIGRDYWDSWMDPTANVRFAHWLYEQSGWQPWECR